MKNDEWHENPHIFSWIRIFLLVTSFIYVFISKPQIDDKYVFATIIICKLFQSINQLVLRADAADIDHKSGCPQWSECCTEYGYCHPKVSFVPEIYQCDWSHYWKHFLYDYKIIDNSENNSENNWY